MLTKFKSGLFFFLGKNWPAVVLILISSIICFKNYTPNTWLSGWDTLHPEFNFSDYFGRIFFGVWQQHQGLGALATQAHPSEIVRMIIYFPMSLVLPAHLLRYFYFFLTLILGPLGVYYFLKIIVFKQDSVENKAVSFCASLFYLLNLATLQQFYVPFEMFATHFASIGFIFLFAIKFIEDNSRKALILYSAAVFLSASMAHTSTLWFAFFGVFGLSIFILCCLKRDKKVFKNSFIILALAILINSFWLLPNLYFIATDGGVVGQSKIQVLFTEEAFAQNASFGTLPDLLIFKNFLFNWSQYIGNNTFGPILSNWANHLNEPFVLLLGYFYSVVALIGVVYSIIKKNKITAVFIAILSICFFFWFNINPPLGFVFSFLQAKIPFFEEAVRFPFTKFSILLTFAVSFYFAWGLLFFIELVRRIKLNRIFAPLLSLFILITLIYYMFPAFKGDFMDPYMRVNIPKEYFSMFKWFNRQPQGRVAYLPIYTFWAWQYYSWNYQGAGFLWFGVKQPIMDREFDRWNPKNEQYYREMSQAVYSQDEDLFRQVIKKYDIQYILVDKSVLAPGPGSSPKILLFDQIDKLIRQGPDFNKVNKFGKDISVYTKGGTQGLSSNDWIYLIKNPKLFSSTLNASYEDFAYQKYGDYIKGASSSNIYLPFENLLDNQNRFLKNSYFTQNGLNIKLPVNNGQLNLDNPQNLDQLLPADIIAEKDKNILNLKFYPTFPITNLESSPVPILAPINMPQDSSAIISVNQNQNFVLDNLSENNPLSLGKIFFSGTNNNTVTTYPIKGVISISPDLSKFDYSLYPCADNVRNPVFGVSDINKNSFSIFGENSQICMTIPIKNIFPAIKEQFSKNVKEILITLSVIYQGGKDSSICIAQLEKTGCLYYFTNNFGANSVNPQQIIQYLGIKENQIDDLGIRIYLDAIDSNKLKKVRYQNLNLSFTKPISSALILPSTLADSFANAKINDLKDYNLTIPFSGNQDLSKDITTLPVTAGDCNVPINPKGARPTNKEIVKDKTNQYIRYFSKEDSYCDHFSYQNLPHNQAYLISITSRNIQGLPLRLCVTNSLSSRCDIYAHLAKSSSFGQELFLLPPMGQGTGYDININNFAIKRFPSTNDVKSINIIPFPYEWLSNIEITNSKKENNSQRLKIISIKHPNQSLYIAKVDSREINSGRNILALSQAYDKGWNAYQINGKPNFLTESLPFVFGAELKNHVMVNNWANGWIIDQSSMVNGQWSIVILFLPQYLEYLGFILTIGTLVYILLLKRDNFV